MEIPYGQLPSLLCKKLVAQDANGNAAVMYKGNAHMPIESKDPSLKATNY